MEINQGLVFLYVVGYVFSLAPVVGIVVSNIAAECVYNERRYGEFGTIVFDAAPASFKHMVFAVVSIAWMYFMRWIIF